MADYTILVTYDSSSNTVTFGGDADLSGGIDVDWGTAQSKTICFQLLGTVGDTWAGIRIARKESDVHKAPAKTETQGLYGSTCFEVGPTNNAVDPPMLTITDVKNPVSVSDGSWFYCLGILHPNGDKSWPDPRIDNPGGERIFNRGLMHARKPQP
ncbi:MAG: hypothetical protein AAGN66_05120 [Acidobacteriota bacterium]